MKDLPAKLSDEIITTFISAYESLEKKNLDNAKRQADKAWGLLPAPKFDWDVSLMFVIDICEISLSLIFNTVFSN